MRNYILVEGFYWLIYVYFQTEKNIVDADIDFFNIRIEQYEELLKVSRKVFWNDDIYVYELPNYFNRYLELTEMYIEKGYPYDVF